VSSLVKTLAQAFARIGRPGAALAVAVAASAAVASPNLYVSASDGIRVIDAANGSLRYTLQGATAPALATLNADHTRLYVPDPIEGTLTVFDTRSRAVLRTYLLTGRPLAIAIPTNDARVFVGLAGISSGMIGAVQAVDTQAGVVGPPTFVAEGIFMDVSPDGSTLFLQDNSQCGVFALDTSDFSQKAAGASFCDAEGGAVVSPDGSTLYVNAVFGAIDVFDTTTLEMRSRIPMPWAGGDVPTPMAITRDGNEIIVGDSGSGVIAFVDAEHGVLEATTSSCEAATGVAFSADERLVYVLCDPSFDGAVLDAHTHALLRTFPAGSYPSSARNFVGDPPVPLYVADRSDSGDVVAIDSLSRSLGAPSHVGSLPEGVVGSPDGRWLYVSNGGDDTVSVVNADIHSEVATIGVGHHPTGLALSPDGTRLYVANTDGDSVSIIDTSSRAVLSTVAVDANSKPSSLALSADGAKLYIALSNWVYIAVYDAAAGALSAPIYCASGISGLAMTPDGTTAYGAASMNNVVYKIDVATDTIVDTWSVGIDTEGSAHPIVVSPDGSRLFVGRGSTEVLPPDDAFVIAVDTSDGSELSWTALADTPAALAIEPEGRFVYAALPGVGAVQVVDTTTSATAATIGGFAAPVAIAPPVEPIMDGLFGSGFD